MRESSGVASFEVGRDGSSSLPKWMLGYDMLRDWAWPTDRKSRSSSKSPKCISIGPPSFDSGPDSVSELSDPDTVESLSLSLESSAVSSVRRLDPVSVALVVAVCWVDDPS